VLHESDCPHYVKELDCDLHSSSKVAETDLPAMLPHHNSLEPVMFSSRHWHWVTMKGQIPKH
jgi:hypothetical protein